MSQDRRSTSRRKILGVSGLALVGAVTGTTVASPDQETGTETGAASGNAASAAQQPGEVMVYPGELRPGARFYVVSPPITPPPNLVGVPKRVLQNYDVRVAEYLSDGKKVLTVVDSSVRIKQGPIYEFATEFIRFDGDGNTQLRSGSFDLVRRAHIVGLDPGRDAGFQGDEDFRRLEGGGKALVRKPSFYPRSHIRIVSQRIPDPPSDKVQGSDIFSEYNMYVAEYWGTNYEFPIYPAHAAEVERGEVYWMVGEGDITEPEGQLTTVDLTRIDETSLLDHVANQ